MSSTWGSCARPAPCHLEILKDCVVRILINPSNATVFSKLRQSSSRIALAFSQRIKEPPVLLTRGSKDFITAATGRDGCASSSSTAQSTMIPASPCCEARSTEIPSPLNMYRLQSSKKHLTALVVSDTPSHSSNRAFIPDSRHGDSFASPPFRRGRFVEFLFTALSPAEIQALPSPRRDLIQRLGSITACNLSRQLPPLTTPIRRKRGAFDGLDW
mmetsp:Transcript_21657/g.88342  ORF Transcript_21657/g.88342 Transcript_21657/m.88342 type:complete len:215 (+) Transcript_21657:2548-3192(+)